MHLPALSHTERKRVYVLFVRMHLPAPMRVRIFADSAGTKSTNSGTHELMDMGHLIDHANAREGGKCKNETHGVLKKVVA